MRKLTTIAIIIVCLLFSASAFSQSSQKENRVDSVALWNKHIDSVLSKTSLKDFNLWLYENATGKQRDESKYADLYNAYIQYQYNLWIAPKSSPKK